MTKVRLARAVTMQLPTFRYHPAPIATGSIQPSEKPCVCCGGARGYIYFGPAYADDDFDDCFCPWCIADGTAHEKFDVEFVLRDGVGNYGHWDSVPADVLDELAHRTPSYFSWQQERWWTHCGDAGEFLGPAGASDVAKHGPATLEHLRSDLGWEAGEEFDGYVGSLDRDGQPTAYLFRCKHCGEVGGFSDFT